MTLEKALWQQSVTYPARLDRRLIQALLAEGVMDSTALQVTERGAGVNYSVDVAAGDCVITGDAVTDQNNYYCRSTAVENKVPSSVPGADSRIDRVVAQIRDNTHDGGGNNDWIISIIAGTVAASPVAPATPASAISLATIGPITPSTTTITNSMITDTRTVSLTRLADNNVTAAKLAADAVTTAKILNANVTTAKIADANVTEAKLATDAVTAAKIAAGAVGNSELATDAVSQVKIADGAVGTAEIIDGNVTLAKLNSDTGMVGAWGLLSLAGGFSGNVVYRKLGNTLIVEVRAVSHPGVSGDTALGTLPAGFRPSFGTCGAPVVNNANTVRLVTVTTGGVVALNADIDTLAAFSGAVVCQLSN